MSEKQRADQVSVNIFDLIDSICGEFRRQWKVGRPPRIEDYLLRVAEDAREQLFRNLLTLEIRYRERAGDKLTPVEYLGRFPDLKKAVGDAFHYSTSVSMEVLRGTPDSDSKEFAPTVDMPAANCIGDYELIRELGRGGFGVVYEARQTKTGNRVALKTLPTGTDGQQVNADRLYRFRREFRSLSEINHPNLVGMQTLEVDGSQWFFTMDLIEGVDFLSYVRPRDQLNEARLRSCLPQLSKGVMELHRRGIIHRDLKPSNVMVTHDGRVAILDFGLAAELQKATDMAQTRSGMFAGTPRYAAPEQMFGERTQASDWYAFGTMLYEALTGATPFHGNDQVALLRQKQEQDPPQLSGRDDVPPDLALLADGLVRRAPQARLIADVIGEKLGLDQETRTAGTTRDSHKSTGSVADAEVQLREFEEEEIVLIGREQQLARLESIRHEFTETQRPAVVWITGLSGEGKSSLVEKFLRPLRKSDELLVMSGRCYDRELVPFKVIDSSIDPLVRFLRSFSEAEIESLLPDDIEMLGLLFPVLRRVEAIDRRCQRVVDRRNEEQVRNLAFAALKDLLVTIGERFPVLWFVDDLQWGDADSAQMLLKLLSPPRPPRLMFIGSFRSDEMAESPFLKAWQSGSTEMTDAIGFNEIKVDPLSENQCLEFLEAKGMEDTVSLRKQVTSLYRESRGNPYFLEQLLETYDDQQQEFESLPLRQIIRKRLAQSPENAKEVLEWIAVFGKAMSVAEIGSLTESSVDVIATVTHMRSEQLVRLMGSRSELRVDTYHDKIRETVLQELTTEERRRLHLKIGETLEAKFDIDPTAQESGLKVPEQVFNLARHFLEAGDRRAFAWQLLAGRTALSAFALDTAVEHFRAAKQICPADASRSQNFELHFGLATALRACGRLSLARTEYDPALNLASTNIDRAKCLSSLSEISFRLSDYEDAWHYVRLALEELGERLPKTTIGRLAKLVPSLIRIHLMPDWLPSRRKRNEEQTKLAARIYQNQAATNGQCDTPMYLLSGIEGCALATCTKDCREKAEAYGIYTHILSVVGLSWVASAMEKASRSYASEDGMSDRTIALLGMASYSRGDLETAEQMIEKGERTIRRAGDYNAWCCQHILWHLWAIRGVPSKVIEHATNERRIASLSEDRIVQSFASYGMAEGLAKQGDTDEAIRCADESVEDLTAANCVFVTVALIQAAKVRIQTGDYEESRQFLARAMRDLPKLRYSELTVDAFALWVESVLGADWINSARGRGRLERIRLAWAVRVARFNGFLFPAHRPGAYRMKGRLLAASGNLKSAFKNFDRAIAAAEAVGADYERARAWIDKSKLDLSQATSDRQRGLELLESRGSVLPDAEVESLEIDRAAHHAHAAASRWNHEAKVDDA